jgi:purine-binding chemotaxis protein CheW
MINTTIVQIWVLRIGNAFVGIEPKSLKEVFEVRRPTQVPLAPKLLVGLVSNGGTILPIFNLSPLVGNTQPLPQTLAGLIEHQGQSMALLVDEVVGLRSNLSGAWKSDHPNPIFVANLELDGHTIQIFDTPKLLEHLSTQMSFIALEQPIETVASA